MRRLAHPPFFCIFLFRFPNGVRVMIRPEKFSLLILAAALPLAGCGTSGDSGGVGGVTVGEARALNEAAAALDDRADEARSALNTSDEGAPARP